MKPLTLRAEQIQPRDDPARVIAERAEAAIARSIKDALRALADSTDRYALAILIRCNDFNGLFRHLAIERLRRALQPALNRLASVHDQSAIAASMSIRTAPIFAKAAPSKLRTTPDVAINLTYDPLASTTVEQQRAAMERLTTLMEDSTQDTAEAILSDGLTRHRSAEDIARALRDTLGLTQQEANAIQSYRLALESGTASPIARALRDRRFDARIRRGDLSDDEIDRMTERYAQRYRAHRALLIARTESLAAANAGRLAAWAQYAEATGRGPEDIRRLWITAGDERTCNICAAIPGMNEGGIPLDGEYDTPIGSFGAPPIHPACRCSERIERIASAVTPSGDTISGVGFRIELDYGDQ